MADEALRELERAVQASPDDGPARVALARALARAGRRLDALDALDLRRAGDACFAEARALADELWREALARLEPAWTIDAPVWIRHHPGAVSFDRAGATLVLLGATGTYGGGAALVDAATGALVAREPAVIARARAAERGALLQVARGPLVRLDRVGAGVERTDVDLDDRVVVSVAPDGRRLVLAEQGRARVHAWPGLEPLTEATGPQTSVDWDLELLVTQRPRAVAVHRFDGSASWEVPLPVPYHQRRAALAPGLHACLGSGARLVDLERRWTAELLPPGAVDQLRTPSLCTDGRGVRVVFDGRPVRFDLDRAAGTLSGAPGAAVGSATLERSATPFDPLLHPATDLWAAVGVGPRAVRTFDDAVVRSLPDDVVPRAWSPDGRSLACTVHAVGGPPPRLALWRVG